MLELDISGTRSCWLAWATFWLESRWFKLSHLKFYIRDCFSKSQLMEPTFASNGSLDTKVFYRNDSTRSLSHHLDIVNFELSTFP